MNIQDILEDMEQQVYEDKEQGHKANDCSWTKKIGVLLTRKEAKAIIRVLAPDLID